MPERDENTARTRRAGELNENQQRRLRISCQYVDKLLADIDDILHASISQSPFPRYIVDVSPAQVRVLEDYIRRIRSQLVHTIAWQRMLPEPPNIPATRAVATNLSFVDIAIEELRPKYMRGFGEVPEGAVAELNGVVHELRSLIDGMQGYLKQELGTNLEKRLDQLQGTGYDVGFAPITRTDRFPQWFSRVSDTNRCDHSPPRRAQLRGCSLRPCQLGEIFAPERATRHERIAGGHHSYYRGSHETPLWRDT